MSTYKDEETLSNEEGYRFVRRTYEPFPNGYSATVAWRQSRSWGELSFNLGVGFVEIAVHYGGNIVYDTPITDDVLRVPIGMTETILRQIERLRPRCRLVTMDGDGPKVLVECDASIVNSGSDASALAMSILRNKDADVRVILDALEESGFERDGGLEITGEWLEKEFPVKRGVDPRHGMAGGPYPVPYYTPIGHRFCEFIDGNCWRESLLIRTRSDARAVWRMLSHLHDDLHEDEA